MESTLLDRMRTIVDLAKDDNTSDETKQELYAEYKGLRSALMAQRRLPTTLRSSAAASAASAACLPALLVQSTDCARADDA